MATQYSDFVALMNHMGIAQTDVTASMLVAAHTLFEEKEKLDVSRQANQDNAGHTAQPSNPQGHGRSQTLSGNTLHSSSTSVFVTPGTSTVQLGQQGAHSHIVGVAVDTPPLATEIKAGEILAWRCWKKSSDGTLGSMVMNAPWAKDKPMRGNPRNLSEGVHAWKTRQQAETYALSYPRSEIAIGTIELWGHVVEHDDGYRAEYGQIKEIVTTVNHSYPHGSSGIHYLSANIAVSSPANPYLSAMKPKRNDDGGGFAVIVTIGLAFVLAIAILLMSQAKGPPHASRAYGGYTSGACEPYVKDEPQLGRIVEVSTKTMAGKSPQWQLRACDKNNDCPKSIQLTHEPYTWQTVGTPVVINWRGHFDCRGNAQWWEAADITAVARSVARIPSP